MHPRHVSWCLACRAASCPPQRALLPQIFLSSPTIQAQGGGSIYSPPARPPWGPRATASIFTHLFLPWSHHFCPF